MTNASTAASSAGDAPGRRARLRSALFLVVLAVLVLASGCRTYGQYDATEKMLPELGQAVQLFESDLERARVAYTMLRRAAQNDSTLRIVADEYEQAIAEHESVLEKNREVLARFLDDLPDYRTMHRNFGAVLSGQQTVRNRYGSLLKAVRYPGVTVRLDASGRAPDSARARALPDTLRRTRDETYTEGRYYVAPIFYERLQSTATDMTMRQALTERQQRLSQRSRLAASGRTQAPSFLGGSGQDVPRADTSGRVPR